MMPKDPILQGGHESAYPSRLSVNKAEEGGKGYERTALRMKESSRALRDLSILLPFVVF
jgi:hypothetical protein